MPAGLMPALRCIAKLVAADGRKLGLGPVELGGDHEYDVALERGVRAEDELDDEGKRGPVLASQLGELLPGGVVPIQPRVRARLDRTVRYRQEMTGQTEPAPCPPLTPAAQENPGPDSPSHSFGAQRLDRKLKPLTPNVRVASSGWLASSISASRRRLGMMGRIAHSAGNPRIGHRILVMVPAPAVRDLGPRRFPERQAAPSREGDGDASAARHDSERNDGGRRMPFASRGIPLTSEDPLTAARPGAGERVPAVKEPR